MRHQLILVFEVLRFPSPPTETPIQQLHNEIENLALNIQPPVANRIQHSALPFADSGSQVRGGEAGARPLDGNRQATSIPPRLKPQNDFADSGREPSPTFCVSRKKWGWTKSERFEVNL
jgi:hypothetical protein